MILFLKVNHHYGKSVLTILVGMRGFLFFYFLLTRNTLTQASKNGRKPYLFPQKKFISVFYAINIFNTIYYFDKFYLCIKTMHCAFCKFHTLFRCCLPRIETKNKIRCIDAPKYAFTQKSTRI